MDISIELGNNKVTVKVLNNSKTRKTPFSWLKRIAGEQQLACTINKLDSIISLASFGSHLSQFLRFSSLI